MFKTILKTKYILVTADFKTVTKKFVGQGASKDEVTELLKKFKHLRDKNRIQDAKEKDIDYWGKKTFSEFKDFLATVENSKSKTKEKEEEKLEGAELIQDDDAWKVYKILNHKACMLYGKGTKWCITNDNDQHWESYSRKGDFYFLISKTKEKDDPWYKIAMRVNQDGSKEFWDAKDAYYKGIPNFVNPPKLENIEIPVAPPTVLNHFKEHGYDEKVKKWVTDNGGISSEPRGKDVYIVIKEYDTIKDYAEDHDKNLQEFLKYEDHPYEFSDDANVTNDEKLDLLEEILNKVNPEEKKAIEDKIYKVAEEHHREADDIVSLLKEDYWGNEEVFTDLNDALETAARDGIQLGMEGDLWDQVREHMSDLENVEMDDGFILDSKCRVGVLLSDIDSSDLEDIEEGNRSLDDVDYDFKKFRYEDGRWELAKDVAQERFVDVFLHGA